MQLHKVNAKKDFNKFLKEEVGYHAVNGSDNIESNYVAEISEDQADFLRSAAQEIYGMCLAAVDKVIREKRFEEFSIGPLQAEHITASWRRQPAWTDGTTRDPEIYGRIDFCWDGKDSIKFYEINADTPTTAYECSVVQWQVVKELMERGELPEGMSQFNSLEEKVTDRLSHIFNMASSKNIASKIHFTSMTDCQEDLATTRYMKELAEKAGWETKYVDINMIGANENPDAPEYGALYDENDEKIEALYKLIPWEHLYESPYAKYIARDEVLFLEPAWKAILSNKMLSVILWEMYPEHPYLLPAFTVPGPLGDTYVEKPIFGRIGADIKVVKDSVVIAGRVNDPDPNMPKSDYSEYPKIYQKFYPLPEIPELPGWNYRTGVWVVGNGEVGGMDLLIDKDLVTGSGQEKFLPHIVRPKQKTGLTL